MSDALRPEIRFGNAEWSAIFDMNGALGDPTLFGLPSELSTTED